MKQVILLVLLLFGVNFSLFCQDVFKLGIVKGKNVKYEVKEYKWNYAEWTVRNIHNPDTMTRWEPVNNPGANVNLSSALQIGQIVRKRQCYPDHYDGFWLNIDPDRLHEIEQDIVKRFKVPEISEDRLKDLLTEDLPFCVFSNEILEVEKVMKVRKKRQKQDQKEWDQIRKEREREDRKQEKR